MDLALEAISHESGKIAGMIQVGMCEDRSRDTPGLDRKSGPIAKSKLLEALK